MRSRPAWSTKASNRTGSKATQRNPVSKIKNLLTMIKSCETDDARVENRKKAKANALSIKIF